MNNINPARGFRDFSPASKRHKEDLLARIRDVYRKYGFDEIETPVAEPLERLRSSDGGENVGMIFQILQRGLTQEQLIAARDPSELCDLGLRYDLTVPLARFFASNQGQLPEILRSIQIGPVWRAERPQKGRYRQFTQCDIDIVGDRSTLAEIELIIATLAALDAIGLRDSVVRINDRRFLDALLADASVSVDDRPRALVVIDKLDKIGLQGVAEGLVGFLSNDASQRLNSTLDRLHRYAEPTIDDFLREVTTPALTDAIADNRSIISAVRSVCGLKSIRFDPTLVRGLGYYTGPIFEIENPLSKSSVAGGGRYDDMIGKFLGRSVPACGFSLGFDRLLELTTQQFPAVDKKIALIYDADDYSEPTKLFERQRDLLALGFTVRLTRSAKNMKRVLNEVAASGYQQFQHVNETASTFKSVSIEE